MAKGVPMLRSTVPVVVALLLAASLALIGGWPASALDADEGPPESPLAASATSPLLAALGFAPPEAISFEFTDWTELKALHDGDDITSASPLEERQRLVLDMARSESSRFGFGLYRLATWPDVWGWDNTDLAWEATWISKLGASARVLRFRDGWDPGPFIDRLEGYGYSRTEKAHGTVFSDPPDFTAGPDTEAILDADERLPMAGLHSVAISPDGRTVVMRDGDAAHGILKRAARADFAAVADSSFGRVAIALERPVTASIFDGKHYCAHADSAEAGTLHPYQALGTGYERAGTGEPALGRYAFAYKRAKQAKADLPDRRTLIDEGYSSRHGQRYRDAAFTLVDASVDGRELILDVAPLHDHPEFLFDVLFGWPSFMACD